jgi:sugar transferase (PEP-CTERM system associated)
MNVLTPGGRSRFFAFLLEAALTVGFVYAVGRLTLVFMPHLTSSFDALLAAGAALPLTASVTLARHTRRRFHGTLSQEATLASLLSVMLVGLTAAAVAVFEEPEHRDLLFAILLGSTIVVPGAAFGWRWVAAQLRLPGFCSERVLILGTGAVARSVSDYITAQRGEDFDIVGFVRCTDEPPARGLTNVAPLMNLDSLMLIDARTTDRIVVALTEKRGTLPVRQLIDLRLKGMPVEESTSFIERSSGKIHIQSLLPSWLIFSDGFRVSSLRALSKRAGDFVLASLLLIVASPVMLAAALAIRLSDWGPVFYRQARVGLDGRLFWILKFRSMVTDAEKLSGPAWCDEDDPRITRAGRVLRKLRIDELPQVWNVLKGEMSFVGPRPERPVFVCDLKKQIPFYGLRHSVRPGITGWAQVKYRYGSSREDALEKLKYDLFYIKNASLMLDIWIVIKTVKVVLLASGSR